MAYTQYRLHPIKSLPNELLLMVEPWSPNIPPMCRLAERSSFVGIGFRVVSRLRQCSSRVAKKEELFIKRDLPVSKVARSSPFNPLKVVPSIERGRNISCTISKPRQCAPAASCWATFESFRRQGRTASDGYLGDPRCSV